MGIIATTTMAAAVVNHAVHAITPAITPAITTAFKPAPTCLSSQYTMMENRNFEIWLNYPLPVPHSTVSDCYPRPFMDSIIASAAGTTQAAFNPLVCPQGHTTVSTSWKAASNYIACCPNSYGLATDENAPDTRPALNAKCYTNLPSGSTLQMTVYGDSSISNTNAFSVSASTMQAYALPIEGYAAKDVGPISVSATATSGSSQATPSSSSVSQTATSSPTPASTHTIIAAESFFPNSTTAQIGDTILFRFTSGNHSLTQTTFNTPCQPLPGGADSGFRPNIGNVDPYPSYEFQVDTADPQWFYSEGAGDCALGMGFGLNPNSTETFTEFQRRTIAEAAQASGADPATKNKSSGGTSKAVKIGVSVGIVLFVLLVAAALGGFFVYRRRKAASSPYEASNVPDYYAADYKNHHEAEMNVLDPTKKYELSVPDPDPLPPHELPAPTPELPVSRFSEHVHSPTKT